MMRHPQPAHEIPEGGAAAEEHVLPVVHLDAVDRERCRLPAQQPAALEERDLPSRLRQVEARSQPGKTGSDDRYTGVSHERAATAILEPTDNDVRCLKGREGSRSIRSRIRR